MSPFTAFGICICSTLKVIDSALHLQPAEFGEDVLGSYSHQDQSTMPFYAAAYYCFEGGEGWNMMHEKTSRIPRVPLMAPCIW